MQGWIVRKSHRSKRKFDDSWGPRRFLLGQGLADTYSEETERVIDVTLKTNYFMAGSNIKAQKDAGTINPLEYL